MDRPGQDGLTGQLGPTGWRQEMASTQPDVTEPDPSRSWDQQQAASIVMNQSLYKLFNSWRLVSNLEKFFRPSSKRKKERDKNIC